MARNAREAVEAVRRQLAPAKGANRLVPVVAEGRASREVLAAFAAEQQRIIGSDRRSFLFLAARAAADPPVAAFFETLARGESLALAELEPFAAACGLDDVSLRAYEPLAGCQGYPAYLAWLALNADPADTALALTANLAAWGGYCATVGQALRRHYGFDDAACAFFDFFAAPAPELEEQALLAVRSGLDAGRGAGEALRHGRLLQGFELMFWNTLADRVA